MENVVPRTDLRVVKTKRAIKGALTQLLAEHDISEITVKDIAERALISKKTFYAHYRSVYAVLDEVADEMARSLTEIVDELDLRRDRMATKAIFEKLTSLINDDAELYGRLLQSTTCTVLLQRVREVLEARLVESMARLDADRERLSYAVGFVASGVVSVYQRWFATDRERPLDEVAQMAADIAFGGMTAFTAETRS